MGPSAAFLLLVVGVLAIEFEFLRPGRVLPGMAGIALTIAGLVSLWRNSPTRTGLLLLIAAAGFFSIQALWSAYLLPGMLGTICVIVGFLRIFSGQRRIAPGLAIPASILLGAVTAFIAFEAQKARQNKRSDL